MAQQADAQGVDERVAEIGAIEGQLTADIGQAQAIPITADAGDNPRQHPAGVGLVERPETERIHHADGPRPHGQNVADDSADTGGGTLVRLDIAGMVMRLDLEGDRVTLPNVNHAGVLTDASKQLAGRSLRRQLGELAQMHLGRLVRAVLRPHDGVHGELG